MGCQHCYEQRTKVLNAVGLGRFAPVANVHGKAAIAEVPAKFQATFGRYLDASDGTTAQQILFSSAYLAIFALTTSCPDRACAERNVDEVCRMIRELTLAKYDTDTGKRREVIVPVPAMRGG